MGGKVQKRKRLAVQRAASQNAVAARSASRKPAAKKRGSAAGSRVSSGGLSSKKRRVLVILCAVVFIAGMIAGMGSAPLDAMATITPQSIGNAIDLGVSKLWALFGHSGNTGTDGTVSASGDAEAFVKKAGTTLHFLPVGNADCTLIISKGKAFLIDAGNSGDAKTIKAYLEAQGVKSLEAVVATHPHADHIGAMASVIREFKPKRIYMPDLAATTKTFENMLNAIEETDTELVVPEAGDSFKIGEVSYTVLGPLTEDDSNTNNHSIMLRGVCGNVSFLMCGDAEKAEEAEILADGRKLSSTILKVAHHGRKTSSTEEFIKAVSPKIAVIHCGENADGQNGPDESVLNRLKDVGATVYRTDKKGTVVVGTDGKTVKVITTGTVKKEASDTIYITGTIALNEQVSFKIINIRTNETINRQSVHNRQNRRESVRQYICA